MKNVTHQEFCDIDSNPEDNNCADKFQKIYDANPEMKNIVGNFDKRGVTLSTKTKRPEDSPEGGESDIQSSAKQGATAAQAAQNQQFSTATKAAQNFM